MRPLRVLQVVANRWWTGSADPALDLALGLRRLGHTVLFACIPGDVLEARAREAGIEVVSGLALTRSPRPSVLLGDVRRLREVVRVAGIDLIHAHQSHDHWLSAVAARTPPIGLVRTVHHRRAVHGDPAARWLWRRTDAVIAVSQGIAERLAGAGVPASRVSVVPGAIDPDRFAGDGDGSHIRRELALGPDPVVGCVARLAPGRGHDVLLEAMRLLRARVPAARLVLAGRGEERPALETRVRALGLEGTVVFAGYRADDLPAVLAALDCFVLLGGGSEESCRAVLEAMAAACPVVAARVGALPETVIDGETGWLVDREPAAVAAALASVLADPARARAMGLAGRQRIVTHFTSRARAQAVGAVYERILPRV